MNVSLRSHMVAGVAALGATAVAIVPITSQQDLLPTAQRTAVAVELSGLANPIGAFLGSLGEVNSYLFDTFTFDEGGVTWPENFYGTYTYAPLNYGIVPDLVNQFSTGALSGLVNNLSGYGWAGLEAGGSLRDPGAEGDYPYVRIAHGRGTVDVLATLDMFDNDSAADPTQATKTARAAQRCGRAPGQAA